MTRCVVTRYNRDSFMTIRITLIFAITFAILCDGCASSSRRDLAQARSRGASTQITVGPATQPADAKADLRLEEIQPAPELPATQPANAETIKPPLEALELYARARDALAGGHQFTAISALERAIQLDPNSAELNRLLSRAYTAGGNNSKALDALLRATQLAPDDLRSRTALARMYLQRGNAADAMDQLRLGVQTKQYREDEAAAAVADYFLARALQQQGYDRAALDQYEKLLDRLSQRSLALRSDAELADWSARPQSIYSDVARLYGKQGEYQKSLDAWRQVASFDLDDLDTRARIIDMLIALGRRDEALREAAEAIRQAGATTRSLEILRDAAQRIGQENAVYDELRRLQQERPGDRSLLFARVDLLSSNGRDAEAQVTLEQAARVNFDTEIVRRLNRFYSDRGKSADAAKLLIEAATAKPDETAALMQSYFRLLQPLWQRALRPGDVQKISVAPAAEAVKQYFVAIAASRNRPTLMREALEKSTRLEPLFAPAYRLAMMTVWQRSDLDTVAKERAAQELIDRAEESGPAGFSQELRAWRLHAKGESVAAIGAFEEAFKLSAPSPEPIMLYANLLDAHGTRAKYEQTIWRLISEFPAYSPAYERLIEHHLQRGGSVPAALNALQRWRSADPASASARLVEAQIMSQSGASRDVVRLLTDLVNENPQDADVLATVSRMLWQVNQTGPLTQALEAQLARNPRNVLVASQLVQTYQRMQRLTDAQRVAETVETAVAGDARSLYIVAQLWNEIDQKPKSREVLQEALRIDPTDPGINNDLGYTWADDGINLDRAEQMTRRAVEAEPDNGSFLDSLGWVLYKRGQFQDARRQLEQAIRIDATSDPVVLDHLGDTLYRLNDAAGAQAQWQKSLERLVLLPGHSEINTLRPALEGKIRQAQMGQPVNVAPVSIEPPSPLQAKN
ncbi:hypothetical protein BH09PLA1_BH09PLA1_22870 [soil metagenome]